MQLDLRFKENWHESQNHSNKKSQDLSEGWGNDSVFKVIALYGWGYEFDAQNPSKTAKSGGIHF